MAEPIFPGTYHPPGLRRQRRLELRIKRRARELSLIAYCLYLEEIRREIDAGRLEADLVEHYTPEHIAALPWQKQLARR